MFVRTMRIILSLHQKRYFFIIVCFWITGFGIMSLHFSSIEKEADPENSSNKPPVFSALSINWDDLDQRERRYDHIIKAAALRYDIDPSLIKAIIQVESRFDHQAVSPRGANGLMQIRPRIASSQGCRDPFDPKENIYAGAGYLRSLLDFFEGDQNLALAAYNAGMSQVLFYADVPPFKETRHFIKNVQNSFQNFRQTANDGAKKEEAQKSKTMRRRMENF